VTDRTTYQRLKAFVEELRQRLQHRLAARRSRKRLEPCPRTLETARPPSGPRSGILAAGGTGTQRELDIRHLVVDAK
jgi:hypothetical protein